MGPLFTNICDNTGWSGLGAGHSLTDDDRRPRPSGWTWALARRSGQELMNSYVVTNSPEHAPLRRFLKSAVDQLQMQFDASVVTSVQPKSLITQMRAAVADCDDVSSDGSLMLLSPPRDIPDAELPVGSDMEIGTRIPPSL